jgi:hypothetical protein
MTPELIKPFPKAEPRKTLVKEACKDQDFKRHSRKRKTGKQRAKSIK